MQPQTQGDDCSADGGEEGAASSLFHGKHGEDGRGKKTGTKMAKEKEGKMCFFLLAPLNTAQLPQRRPIRIRASELAGQWEDGT